MTTMSHQLNPDTYLGDYFAGKFDSISNLNALTHRLAGGNTLMNMIAREGNTDALTHLFGGAGVPGAIPQAQIPQVMATQVPGGIAGQQILNSPHTGVQSWLSQSGFGDQLAKMIQTPEFQKLASSPQIQQLASNPQIQQLAGQMLQSGDVQKALQSLTTNLVNGAGANGLGGVVPGQAGNLLNTVRGLGMTGGARRTKSNHTNEFNLSSSKTAALRRELDLEGGRYDDDDDEEVSLTEYARTRNGLNLDRNDDSESESYDYDEDEDDIDDDVKFDEIEDLEENELSRVHKVSRVTFDDDTDGLMFDEIAFDTAGTGSGSRDNANIDLEDNDSDGYGYDDYDYDSESSDGEIDLTEYEGARKKSSSRNNPNDQDQEPFEDDSDAEEAEAATKSYANDDFGLINNPNQVAYADDSDSDIDFEEVPDETLNADEADLDEVDEDEYTKNDYEPHRVRVPENDDAYKQILDKIIDLLGLDTEEGNKQARLYRVALKVQATRENPDLKGNKNEVARNKKILEYLKNKKTLQDTIKKVDLVELQKELESKRKEFEARNTKTRSASSKSVTSTKPKKSSSAARNNLTLSTEEDTIPISRDRIYQNRRAGRYNRGMHGGFFLNTDQLELSDHNFD
jgi:hypothetical protein